MNNPAFPCGALVITANAQPILEPEDVALCLQRHLGGDWGDVCAEYKEANDWALRDDARLLSAYVDRNGTKFWIITEADRSVTTILLPEDY